MVHVPLMFPSEWREFPSASCLAKKKHLMIARVLMLLKSHASPDMLPFSLCKEKTCNSTHEQTPLSNDTIDSVLRHREVGRAKDLSAPSGIVDMSTFLPAALLMADAMLLRGLNDFRRVRKPAKATIIFVVSVCLSVCPSVRLELDGSHWTEFPEILYMRILRKLVAKMQVSLNLTRITCALH